MGLFNWKKMKLFNRNKEIEKEPVLDELTQKTSNEAEGCVDRFKEAFGEGLDFSESSLKFLEGILEILSESYPDMENHEKELVVNHTASYIFEVARRNYGGKYFITEENRVLLVTGLPRFEVSIDVHNKVKGRLLYGRENNIPFFFRGYSERVRKAKRGDRVMIR